MFKQLLIGLVVFLFVVAPGTLHAASLYIEPNDISLMRGDTATLSVRIDTDEDECVNVVDAVIHYPPNLEPVDTSRGNSIFTIWVEDPVINKKDRTITFAGGIPNGYCGRIPGDPRLTNVVIELLFRSPGMVIGAVDDSDEATITFGEQTRVLLNDGFGTEAPLRVFGTKINLLKTVGNTINDEWLQRINDDVFPPEEFTLELHRSEQVFSNKYYIVFNTTDKQSGIDHYEVIEEPLTEAGLFSWGAATAPWVNARSPYVLEDQSLNSTIRVRAIDKAGNEYVATLIPDESKRTMSVESKVMLGLVIVVLLLFVLTAVVSVWWYVRQRRGRVSDSISEDHDDTMLEDEVDN